MVRRYLAKCHWHIDSKSFPVSPIENKVYYVPKRKLNRSVRSFVRHAPTQKTKQNRKLVLKALSQRKTVITLTIKNHKQNTLHIKSHNATN